MRLSIGIKIFSIAVFLALVMVIAAFLSESRVRQAQIEVDVLADHLLSLVKNANELRTIILRETIEFRNLISTGDEFQVQQVEQVYNDYFRNFTTVANQMHGEIDLAITKLPAMELKLTLVDIKAHLEALASAHEQLHALLELIVSHQKDEQISARNELIDMFEQQDEALIAANRALTYRIGDVVNAIAANAKIDEAAAISFEHIVTAIAAILGLLLAGIMTRGLLVPIHNLQRASHAVKDGDLTHMIEVSGHDELSDLANTFNLMVEQLREKEKVEAVFGRYVDPRVVTNLVNQTGEDTEELASAGRQEATIFFSDIADYTSISERMTPTSLVHLMNEYFTIAAQPITNTGGMLDKFIGDAVMAFWCPPFNKADKIGMLACEAAIEEIEALHEFQQRLPEITGMRVGAPAINIRIGLATGEVIVGSIGSTNKRNFTVIGDTVNLSSRLESANKYYGTNILICERTREMIDNSFTTREIDNLAVKGKTESVRIFELFSKSSPSASITEAFEAFSEGLNLYRQGNWEKALSKLDACLKAKPDDAPAHVFINRIEKLKTMPPAIDWDGIWHLDSK